MAAVPGTTRDFFELVKAIGESKSKQEEDRIIADEVGEETHFHNSPKRETDLCTIFYTGYVLEEGVSSTEQGQEENEGACCAHDLR